MKAIILAGGSGTRLYPTTQIINKHLLPIYNKPMIYYPLSLAMLLKIKDIYMVVNPQDKSLFEKLLGDGSQLGIRIQYVIQEKPRGLSEGILLCSPYIEKEPVLYLLGDNILYGHDLPKLLESAKKEVESSGGAYCFGYYVHDPEMFGIVEFDEQGNVLSIEEKPQKPKSHYAVIGVYFFDGQACKLAQNVKPSARGELEITSLLEEYLKLGKLKVKLLGRGFAWFDAGTYESFLEAGNFVATIERKTGLMIGCPEEIAFRNGWISKEDLLKLAKKMDKTDYGKYLRRLAEEEVHAF